MNFFHYFYNLLQSGLTPIVLPVVWCGAGRHSRKQVALAQRLGCDLAGKRVPLSGRPRIWIHAVSVGEVKAAEAIVQALDRSPNKTTILLTTTTATGQRYARRQLGHRTTVRYAPVDLWWVVRRFLTAYRPDMLICMETEIWPNWIVLSHHAGIKTVFLNGRISSRSIGAYLKIRPFIGPVLEQVDAFSMISEPDAQRIIALGAPAHRVSVNGNVKMDISPDDQEPTIVEYLKRLLAVNDRTPVFIGGSVRGMEADMLLELYLRAAAEIPGMFLILAPRHIEKTNRIMERARARGIACQRRTDLGKPGVVRTAPVVILDTIGELRHVYGIASVVFGGASLVPLGGQNVLEAAIWAKPVLFGPFMDDFREASDLLEASGGGICVKDLDELIERVIHLLKNPDQAKKMGHQAQQAVLANQGAAARHAEVASRLLQPAFARSLTAP